MLLPGNRYYVLLTIILNGGSYCRGPGHWAGTFYLSVLNPSLHAFLMSEGGGYQLFTITGKSGERGAKPRIETLRPIQ